MDKAYWGTMRWGYFRWGVYLTTWDDALTRLENEDVSNLWTDILNRLAEVIDSTTFNVTRRILSLSAHTSRDAWNGFRTKTFTTSTIKMPIIKGGATQLALLAGIYPSVKTRGLTAGACSVGDQILDSNSEYWDVETVEKVYWGDSFINRECGLGKIPLYQADFGTTTWTEGKRPDDARYRIKVWMDDKLRDTQITKDDDTAKALYAVIFNNPPYPLQLEFRHPSTPVQGLYVVNYPESTPIRSGDQIIRSYTDMVPIHIFTVNSTACSGDALATKMLKELQYICETSSEGSQRNLETRRRKPPIDLGGVKLFEIETVLGYTRDTTT